MKESFAYTSRFDGTHCICVITGADGSSTNAKTGAMAQVWFLQRDNPPHVAVKKGCDRGVCGTCPLRAGRGCYVRADQAPLAIWKKWHAGGYREELPASLPAVRFGAYGDPASLPFRNWAMLVALLCPQRWTGYTHGWRRAPWLKGWCMASVEYEGDGQKAYARGWSVFETVPSWRSTDIDGRLCANVTRDVQCEQCLRCCGAPDGRQRWIQIPAHGARKNMVHGD